MAPGTKETVAAGALPALPTVKSPTYMGAVADQIKSAGRAFQMQSPINLSVILVLALLASAGHALAQTGEFPYQPPGSTVQRGYALQDWWQNARNRAFAGPSVEPAQGPKPRQMNSYENTKRHDK
jgi:hypothetical protein